MEWKQGWVDQVGGWSIGKVEPSSERQGDMTLLGNASVVCFLGLLCSCCDPNIVAGMESNRKQMMMSFRDVLG